MLRARPLLNDGAKREEFSGAKSKSKHVKLFDESAGQVRDVWGKVYMPERFMVENSQGRRPRNALVCGDLGS